MSAVDHFCAGILPKRGIQAIRRKYDPTARVIAPHVADARQRLRPEPRRSIQASYDAISVWGRFTSGRYPMGARAEVRSILDRFGWETVDLGQAEAARAIEPLCMLWCIPGLVSNQWTHAFKLLRSWSPGTVIPHITPGRGIPAGGERMHYGEETLMNDSLTANFGLGQIGQIAVSVSDIGRAIAFYRDILGMRFLFHAPPGLGFFDCAGVRLMLDAPARVESQNYSSVIYYKVLDLHAAFETLSARGVRFEAGPHLVAKLPDHELWMAFFRDPDGNLLALMSEVRP